MTHPTIESLLMLGRESRVVGQLDKSVTAYRQAAQIARDSNSGDLLYALRHLTDVAREAGDVELALSSGKEAVALALQMGDEGLLEKANTLRLYALALESNDEGNEAMPFWAQARSIYASVGVEAGVLECEAHLT